MHQHIQEPPPPPSGRTELPVSPALDALVLTCLAKKPEHRPADADELRQRLFDLRQADTWTRERRQRWWDTHFPVRTETPQACDEAQLVPALSSE